MDGVYSITVYGLKCSPDLPGSEQGVTLVLHHTGPRQLVLVTEGQQLAEQPRTASHVTSVIYVTRDNSPEVAHTQAAHGVPHVAAHGAVGLQSHLRTPVSGHFLKQGDLFYKI